MTTSTPEPTPPTPSDDESPDDVDPELQARVELDRRCLALRRTGATIRDIAGTLGVSHGRAHRGVIRAREAEPALDPEGVRADLSATLDRALLELSRIIASDVPDDRKIRATTALVAVVDRKAKLHGADAPIKRQIDVHVLTPEALADEQGRLERELEAAGVDVSALPSPDDLAGWIDATATVNSSA